MSKLLENKQIVHVATEIVVLIGLTFYFSSKNKKLLDHIEDLSQRLEDQEDMIQKHEQIIKQLVQVINNRPSHPGYPSEPKEPPKPPVSQKSFSSSSHSMRHRRIEDRKSKHHPRRKKISHPPVEEEHIYEEDEKIDEVHNAEISSENDSELDAEIAVELKELKGNNSLKKEQ